MWKMLLLFLPSALISSSHAQDLVEKNIHALSGNYDQCYTYSTSKDLNRTVCIKDSSFELEYLYTYTDPSGIIKIQLPNNLAFVEEMMYEIDTTLQISTSDFQEGMAAVRDVNTNLLGFIDDKGKVVIKPQYTVVGAFSEGLAYFAILEQCLGGETRPNKMGYINPAGQRIIQLPPNLSELYGCCYFYGQPFKKGKANMYMREFGYDCNCFVSFVIDKTGKVLEQEGDLYDINYQKVKIK